MEDKTQYILTELDEVKDIMMENVKNASHHVVQLEDLDQKTENIRQLSETLGKKSRVLRAKECWRDYREKFIAAGIIFMLAFVIILFMSISLSNQTQRK
jgi:ABC-type lipoprotein release transport system permease subunit